MILIAPHDQAVWPDAGGGCLFWYLGCNSENFVSAVSRLPESWRVAPVGERVNEAAGRLQPFLADLESLLFEGPPPPDWWAGRLAERNPYVSDTFVSLAQALVLVEAARAGGRHVVAVEDAALGHALADVLGRAGIAARWLGPKAKPCGRLAGLFRATAAALRDAWRADRAMAGHGMTPGPLRPHALWLMTWAGESTFAGAGRDTFLGNLPVWLREDGRPFGWLGNPTGWTGSAERIAMGTKASAGAATLIPALIPFRAWLGAAWRALRLAFIRPRPLRVAGIDLSPLIERALDQDCASGTAARSLAFDQLARHCRSAGLAPRVLVYPYENQPWEKMLLAGFRRHLPGTRLIGVQHAIFADRYISADPTPRQMQAGLFPDLLVCSGEAFRDRLLAAGVPAERLRVGGAIRFPELAATADGPARTAIRTVLATLPMQSDEALELAQKAAAAVAELGGLRLLVNFHPMTDDATRSKVRKAGAAENVTFVEGPAGHWLGESDLLLYNSSGTVFEAAAAGVAAIYVGPACGLDLEKLPGGSMLRCRTPDELAGLIGTLCRTPSMVEEALCDTRAKAARTFAPPDRTVWRAVLDA